VREIKFRAWDKLFKEMFDVAMVSREAVFHAIPPKSVMPSGIPLAQVELMQFTGLLDKQGKEIYEGDIVRATANGNRKYEIVWLGGGLGHWWIADIQRDNLIPNKIPINLNAIEVIGNIYENPELSEGVCQNVRQVTYVREPL